MTVVLLMLPLEDKSCISKIIKQSLIMFHAAIIYELN